MRLAMQLHEEPLPVAVEAALTHLIRGDLHERVVSALLLHRQLQRTEQPRILTGARGVRGTLERKLWKEVVSDFQHVRWLELSSIEMTHRATAESHSSRTESNRPAPIAESSPAGTGSRSPSRRSSETSAARSMSLPHCPSEIRRRYWRRRGWWQRSAPRRFR